MAENVPRDCRETVEPKTVMANPRQHPKADGVRPGKRGRRLCFKTKAPKQCGSVSLIAYRLHMTLHVRGATEPRQSGLFYKQLVAFIMAAQILPLTIWSACRS